MSSGSDIDDDEVIGFLNDGSISHELEGEALLELSTGYQQGADGHL